MQLEIQVVPRDPARHQQGCLRGPGDGQFWRSKGATNHHVGLDLLDEVRRGDLHP